MTTTRATVRLLIVEDNQQLADVLIEFLTELGHEVRHAPTAAEALSALERERPDMILLDLYLPGMSGLEFLRLASVREGGIPVVAMSGVATEEEAHAALALGAFDFLAKPITLERLEQLIGYLEGLTVRHRENLRRVPRVTAMFPVGVDARWQWRALDLSPFGVKVAPQAWLRGGARVRLMLALPDGQPPLEVEATLVRADPDGDVFSFLDLEREPFRRLLRFVTGRRPPEQPIGEPGAS